MSRERKPTRKHIHVNLPTASLSTTNDANDERPTIVDDRNDTCRLSSTIRSLHRASGTPSDLHKRARPRGADLKVALTIVQSQAPLSLQQHLEIAPDILNCSAEELEGELQPLMMAQAVPNPPPNDKKRVKVYELRNNDWFDRGTGFCTAAFLFVRLAFMLLRFALAIFWSMAGRQWSCLCGLIFAHLE